MSYQEWRSLVQRALDKDRPGVRLHDVDEASMQSAFMNDMTPIDFVNSLPPVPVHLQRTHHPKKQSLWLLGISSALIVCFLIIIWRVDLAREHHQHVAKYEAQVARSLRESHGLTQVEDFDSTILDGNTVRVDCTFKAGAQRRRAIATVVAVPGPAVISQSGRIWHFWDYKLTEVKDVQP